MSAMTFLFLTQHLNDLIALRIPMLNNALQECVISSCFDPGGPTRELEQLLLSIVNNATSELSY